MPIVFTNHIFSQPPQAIPTSKKDEEWKKSNLDWAEQLLKHEIEAKAERLKKNYNIAQGVIDIEDYINVDSNAYREVFDIVEEEKQDSLFQDNEIVADDLHFYPIVPAIINVLSGEKAKKFDHIKIKAIDDLSSSEYFNYKKSLVVEYLTNKINQEIQQKLESKLDPESEEYQQAFQQEQQKRMSLPEIEKFMSRNYRNDFETWSNRILQQAEFKYKLPEKEIESFKHMLIADEAYWEIKFLEDDIDVELWNPKETICIKPHYEKYTSNGSFIGRQYYTTLSSALSRFGDKIDYKVIEKYDTDNSVEPSLSDRKVSPDNNVDHMKAEKKLLYFKYVLGDINIDRNSKVMITECYWLSYRRLSALNAIYEGESIYKIVDDSFEVTLKPVYNEEDELIAGEELEHFYVPQVWKGVKLNFSLSTSPSELLDENKYLDEVIGKKTKKKEDEDEELKKGNVYIDIQPIDYQFTDSFNVFKPKLPVVGCNGFEPSMNLGVPYSLIDKTKSYQVMFNSCMNQIDNFMRTEIGMFYILDQKLIPKNSMDGSWGKNNWMKFLLTAKDSQLGVVDGSTANTEGGTHQQPTVVNLLKNEQFKSRIELAMTFKNLLFETIGVSPQRLGNINSQETATGINQAISNSYSQTDMYFVNHTYLMREVKEMILDAEKYMESKKPVSRVQYLNSEEENIMFEMDTDDLLLRRANIYLVTNPDSQRVLEQLRQLAIQNNTSGASILDLATIIESSNVRDIKDTLKVSMMNMQRQEQEKRAHEQQMLQDKIAADAAEKEKERVFEAEQNERDRIVQMYEADVRAMGFAKNQDTDNSGINDILEVDRFNMEQNKNYSSIISNQMEIERKRKADQNKLSIEQQKIVDKRNEVQIKEQIENKKIKRDYDNMANDLKVAEKNAQGRSKK